MGRYMKYASTIIGLVILYFTFITLREIWCMVVNPLVLVAAFVVGVGLGIALIIAPFLIPYIDKEQ